MRRQRGRQDLRVALGRALAFLWRPRMDRIETDRLVGGQLDPRENRRIVRPGQKLDLGVDQRKAREQRGAEVVRLRLRDMVGHRRRERRQVLQPPFVDLLEPGDIGIDLADHVQQAVVVLVGLLDVDRQQAAAGCPAAQVSVAI